MFCFWYQWRISQALDGGRALPPKVARHVECCPACGRFFRVSLLTGRRFRQAAEAVPATVLPVTRPRRRGLHGTGALAVAAAMLVALGLATAHWWPRASHTLQPTPDATGFALNLVGALADGDTDRDWLAGAVETPLEIELLQLTRDTEAAATFLLARLPAPATGWGLASESDPTQGRTP